MQVKFYILFAKRRNSTLLPRDGFTSQSFTINCTVNEEASMINPVLKVDIHFDDPPLPDITSPSDIIYCYIPFFKRYYFINDWLYRNGLWYAQCSEDVLGSYRDYIKNENKYVLRSNVKFNNFIGDDHYYPSFQCIKETTHTFNQLDYFQVQPVITPVPMNYYNIPLTNGFVVINCVDAVGDDGYVTYVIQMNGWYKVLKELVNYAPSDIVGVLVPSIAESIYDALKFVINAYWIPNYYNFSALKRDTDIKIGQVTISDIPHVVERRRIDYLGHNVNISDLTNHYYVPTHLNESYYLQLPPYTYREVSIEPFGVFSLDSKLIAEAFYERNASTSAERYLQFVITLDYLTGKATLSGKITNSTTYNTDKDNEIISSSCNFGVPIPIIHQASNDIGIASDILTTGLGVAGLVASPFTGGASLAIAGAGALASGGASLANDLKPRTEKAGNQGTYLPYTSATNKPMITVESYRQISTDYYDDGYPLNESVQLSTLMQVGGDGYIKCADGETSIRCTKAEKDIIANFLTGGFYLE